MNRRATVCLFVLTILVTVHVSAAEPEIVSVKKIWDAGPHNAFTDLIRFEDRWYCCFREALEHGRSLGNVRIIKSQDGNDWKSAALVEERGIDLRDPKLSLMPDGRLLLIMGGIENDQRGNYLTRSPRVSFSADAKSWTAPHKLLAEDHWLWRVTWHNGRAYSVSKQGEGKNPRRGMLYTSTDGLDWKWVTEFKLPDNTWNASETTLRILENDEMIALVRPHWIGRSKPPYTKWEWTKMERNIGGPNFIVLPGGEMWAAGRDYRPGGAHTVLAEMTPTEYTPRLTLPSGGDCSYPGLVWHDGLLWMSYYSSHEGKTSIYLAKIRLPQ